VNVYVPVILLEFVDADNFTPLSWFTVNDVDDDADDEPIIDAVIVKGIADDETMRVCWNDDERVPDDTVNVIVYVFGDNTFAGIVAVEIDDDAIEYDAGLNVYEYVNVDDDVEGLTSGSYDEDASSVIDDVDDTVLDAPPANNAINDDRRTFTWYVNDVVYTGVSLYHAVNVAV
jgi:hypothetical protein